MKVNLKELCTYLGTDYTAAARYLSRQGRGGVDAGFITVAQAEVFLNALHETRGGDIKEKTSQLIGIPRPELLSKLRQIDDVIEPINTFVWDVGRKADEVADEVADEKMEARQVSDEQADEKIKARHVARQLDEQADEQADEKKFSRYVSRHVDEKSNEKIKARQVARQLARQLDEQADEKKFSRQVVRQEFEGHFGMRFLRSANALLMFAAIALTAQAYLFSRLAILKLASVGVIVTSPYQEGAIIVCAIVFEIVGLFVGANFNDKKVGGEIDGVSARGIWLFLFFFIQITTDLCLFGVIKNNVFSSIIVASSMPLALMAMANLFMGENHRR